MSTPTQIARLAALSFLFAVAAVGAVEAARLGERGLAAMFVLLGVGGIGLGLSQRRRPRSVRLRSDLYDWLETAATTTGESTTDLAERCLSACRAQLDG